MAKVEVQKIVPCKDMTGIAEPMNQLWVRRDDGTLDVQTINYEPTMAQQSFREECDINNIMAQYKRTGELMHMARKQGVYADVSEIGDYWEVTEKKRLADEAFMTLPSELRNRFANDPGQLIQFMNDPANYGEAVKLGLVATPQEKAEMHMETKTETKTETQK